MRQEIIYFHCFGINASMFLINIIINTWGHEALSEGIRDQK